MIPADLVHTILFVLNEDLHLDISQHFADQSL